MCDLEIADNGLIAPCLCRLFKIFRQKRKIINRKGIFGGGGKTLAKNTIKIYNSQEIYFESDRHLLDCFLHAR